MRIIFFMLPLEHVLDMNAKMRPASVRDRRLRIAEYAEPRYYLLMWQPRNWHAAHSEELTVGDRIADIVANGMGSWTFIIIQTVFVALWMTLNVIGWMAHWDAYPFILLNLLFSTQAAYAAPVIMMSQNRQSDRDRYQAEADYATNVAAKKEIEELMARLQRIEDDKLEKILVLLGGIPQAEHAHDGGSRHAGTRE